MKEPDSQVAADAQSRHALHDERSPDDTPVATPADWRSLAQLAETPEFQRISEPEFLGFANIFEALGEAEFRDGGDPHPAFSRRQFLALSAASLGLAATAGCRRPDFPILTYAKVPDEQAGHVVPGKPTFYATCLPQPGGAFPVLVESHEGRPTKVEGHPRHPASEGASTIHAQASILDLYSPDRVMSEDHPGVSHRGQARTWPDFDREAMALADRLAKNKGAGFAVLAEDVVSPSLAMLRRFIGAKLPHAAWHAYEPIDFQAVQAATHSAYGAALNVHYRFDRAERILALDSDFLGLDPNSVQSCRWFGARRSDDPMNRLYVVEPTYTITGSMADHRLRLPAARIGPLLVAIAARLRASHERAGRPNVALDVPATPAATDLPTAWINAVTRDLAQHPNRSLIVVGYRQPAWVHTIAHIINEWLGSYEAGLAEFREPAPESTPTRSIAELSRAMAAGKVETLLIVGGNPVVNAPADLAFAQALGRVSTTLRLGQFFDQTSAACDWHLPMAHVFESWGDAESADGTLCCIQPLIAPLNGESSDPTVPAPAGGRTTLEVLTMLVRFAFDDASAGGLGTSGPDSSAKDATTSSVLARQRAYELVRAAFAERAGIKGDNPRFNAAFDSYKQRGFLSGSARPLVRRGLRPGALASALTESTQAAPPTLSDFEVNFHPDYRLLDGRFAWNAWLQELPDPITKLVWDNAALLSPASAAALKLQAGDMITITLADRSIDAPVFVLPGQADHTVSLPFGQLGTMPIGRIPDGGGFNVFPLRTTSAFYFAPGAKLKPIRGRRYALVTTQEHASTDGRDIVRETVPGQQHRSDNTHTPQAHLDHPIVGLLPTEHLEESALKLGFQAGYRDQPSQTNNTPGRDQGRFPLDLAPPETMDSPFQWGMTIDLSRCTGCSACVVACQSENNIPVVGKPEVMHNREMQWIRVDRYFTGPGDADPQMVTQPVACVHCEQAPCEQVCPVNASVHSPEGLNLQVYNRCIGTRYCANACPYKVRRFNWFDFNKRGLDELRQPTPLAEGGPSITTNLLPESLRMQKNPDVTVRMRGVMEKCTYCVQRLERAKQGAKIIATEVAQGRRSIEIDEQFRPPDPSSGYRKPKEPLAAGYDLDANGHVIVPDGVVQTACQQVCPTQAITFGNVRDPASRVAQQKRRDGEYLLLGELNTKPRTSYLPRRRNPNAELSAQGGVAEAPASARKNEATSGAES